MSLLFSDEVLKDGHCITSENKEYFCFLEKDGTFSFKKKNGEKPPISLWDFPPPVSGVSPFSLKCSPNGDVEILDKTNKVVGLLNDQGRQSFGPFALMVRNDGTLILKNRFGNWCWLVKNKKVLLP